MPRKPKAGLAELQAAAIAHAQEYMHNTSLGIPKDVDEDAFATLMDGITRAIIAAWAAGYKAGTER